MRYVYTPYITAHYEEAGTRFYIFSTEEEAEKELNAMLDYECKKYSEYSREEALALIEEFNHVGIDKQAVVDTVEEGEAWWKEEKLRRAW